MDKVQIWLPPLADIIKAAFWPFVVACIFFTFRKEIRQLLFHIKDLELFGNKAAFNQQVASADQQTKSDNQLDKISSTPSGEFATAKASLKLTFHAESLARLISDKFKESTLEREEKEQLGILTLAKTIIIAEHWRVYTYIFGSQIYLLQQINAQPFKEADVANHFLSVKNQFQEFYKDSDAKQYMAFLILNGLVEQKDGLYSITERGKDFLIWCTEMKLALNKPF